MGKDFIIFSKRLAKALIDQGFVLKDKRINNKRPEYYVYVFENTQELVNAIDKTTKRFPNNNK